MIRQGVDIQGALSFESCMSSVACDIQEMSSETSRRVQEKEETMSEASLTAVTKRKEREAWRLQPEAETETLEVTVW